MDGNTMAAAQCSFRQLSPRCEDSVNTVPKRNESAPRRNPQTGEPIQIAAKKTVSFKPAKDLLQCSEVSFRCGCVKALAIAGSVVLHVGRSQSYEHQGG